MATLALDHQHASIISHIADKNAQAQAIIRRYAAQHSMMDIGLGVISLIPGAGIPALLGAIALQSKVIYRPMAEELARVYLSETDGYTDRLGNVASISTVALEFGQEFALEFLAECAQELLLEAGLGAAATFVPIAGAAVAAGLDYLIAQMLTWRVGTMTAIYFQNGSSWIENRKTTMHIAKDLTGGMTVGLSSAIKIGRDRIAKRAPTTTPPRLDLNDIPRRVQPVRDSGAKSLQFFIKSIADKLPRVAVRDSLLAMGYSVIVVDAALAIFYAV